MKFKREGINMDTYKIFEYLLELNQESAKELIKTYYNENNKNTLITIPNNSDDKIRISEQELRLAMVCLHGQCWHPDLLFSIETPTVLKYSFSGKIKRSASSDLTFFHNNKRILNVELKAHNPQQVSINKDIEKLVKESKVGDRPYGAWCHIFKNENKATIERLFEKLNIALNKYRDKDTRPISFHILILKSRVLLSRKGRDFDKTILKNEHLFNIRYNNWKNLSPGKYHFNNGILVDENSSNTDYDWQVDKF
jgi:hypothetical protein|tara:strand:- start:44 stop:802 length:759 start_codon:yes stop_codon:yes gene_type:complete